MCSNSLVSHFIIYTYTFPKCSQSATIHLVSEVNECWTLITLKLALCKLHDEHTNIRLLSISGGLADVVSDPVRLLSIKTAASLLAKLTQASDATGQYSEKISMAKLNCSILKKWFTASDSLPSNAASVNWNRTRVMGFFSRAISYQSKLACAGLGLVQLVTQCGHTGWPAYHMLVLLWVAMLVYAGFSRREG